MITSLKQMERTAQGAVGKKLLSRQKSPLNRIASCWRLYVLLLPAVVYLFIFHYLPMYGVQISFRDYIPTLGISGSPWVGLKHFAYFVNSVQFVRLLTNTLKLSVYSLIFSFPMPIILALLLNEARNLRFKKIVQNVTYAPHFISTVVLVGMLISFLSPSSGIVNSIIKAFGGEAVDFMGRSSAFRSIYIISGIWQGTGWGSIIYLGALSGVDLELHEAAQIDGASRIQRIWHINIPCILPTAVMLFILNCGGILNVGFEKVYLMQNGLNLAESEIISTYVYKTGLLGARFSYTSAIGLFNSVVSVILLMTVNAIARRMGEVSLF